MSTDTPQSPEGLNPWVATAAPPALTVTGHTALITNVRFVWTVECAWCRRAVHLWSDGGTIETGISHTATRQRRTGQERRPRWYTIFKPACTPSVPENCPHPDCHRPATRNINGRSVPTGWLACGWRLALGPFTLTANTPQHHPIPTAHAYRLLDEVWSTLRRTHPDLAAAAARS